MHTFHLKLYPNHTLLVKIILISALFGELVLFIKRTFLLTHKFKVKKKYQLAIANGLICIKKRLLVDDYFFVNLKVLFAVLPLKKFHSLQKV